MRTIESERGFLTGIDPLAHGSPTKAVGTGVIQFAVIGVGRMGVNHVERLSGVEGARLAAVCDLDGARARAVAQRHGVAACGSVDDLLRSQKPDAAVIATTTGHHREVALQCLNAGVHVLLEKPMARDAAECAELIAAAKANRVRLMIGHVERFNPAVRQMKYYIDDGMIGGVCYLETVRSGPYPKQLYGTKDGVVIDLAVHDLDLVHHLTGRLVQVYAHLLQNDTYNQDVYARVMFRTERDVLGSSEFSWISPKRTRTISVYGDMGMLHADLQQQEVWFFENGDADAVYTENYYQNVLWGRVSEGKVTKFPIKREDPLQCELQHFCRLVGNASLEHDPSYGLEAVTWAQAALESARNDRIVYSRSPA